MISSATGGLDRASCGRVRLGSLALALTPLWLSLSATGCYLSHERARDDAGRAPDDAGVAVRRDAAPRDAGHDAGTDAGDDAGHDAGADAGLPPCTPETFEEPPTGPPVAVDLLFVVDSSGSMSEEQRTLAENFPRMLEMLLTGDMDRDGVRDFFPVASLHVGVVTTDLGDDGFGVCGDARPPEGDDAVLRTSGSFALTGCAPPYPSVLSFRPEDGVPPSAFAHDFSCVARVGTQGCGYEQPLEAALKALTPGTSPLRFAHDSIGHGDGANAGFLRDDATLAIVLVTDEDDCSVSDPDLYDPESTVYTDTTNMRCTRYEDLALHAVRRYVDGLHALRASDPENMVLAAIAGVPEDLTADPDHIDYDRILSDPRMVVRENPGRPGHLLPACDVVGRGFAVPARRVVEVTRGFGEQGVVQSICQDGFAGALRGITSRLARVIRRTRCVE